MTRDELRCLIQGPIAGVATPFDDRFELDLGRMHAATQYWVENGLVAGKAVIKVAAAAGEGGMLREEEWPQLLRTVVQAAGGKATIMCGIHHKDTIRTIEDVKRAQDLGAISVQLVSPIFNEPSQDDILRHFDAVSSAIDIGIMIYNTPWLRHGSVAPETIRKMADFERVVAIKWAAPPDVDYDEMRTFAHTFNVIDNTLDPVRGHKLGGRGYINDTADVYPPHDLSLWELMEAHRYDEAQALHDRVNMAFWAFYVKVRQRSGGQARMKKGMMALMGYPMGSSRPPSLPLSQDEMAELRDLLIGVGWPVVAPEGKAAPAGG
jgi:4-hydroxy-tetrahydrodipicolinate synthase